MPSLPKGGGAIRGLGETFKANPATGTASLSVPLPFSKARALTPQHALTYDSGAGNGAFGVGWSVDLPHIARKTDRALPTYDDTHDVFSMGGAELVPMLENGDPVVDTLQQGGVDYQVRRFRPRVEASFDRIELWRDLGNGASHWRVWSSANIVSVFGQSADARISDPSAPTRTFSWHLERVYDGLGNITLYAYKREDDAGVRAGDPHDGPRLGRAAAQLYPRRILYGNRTPFTGALPAPDDFCFRTTFDYGETPALSGREDADHWALRSDPFSRYRAGFELRTRRLCTRVVTEHLFPELGPAPECVRALELTYGADSLGQSRIEHVAMAGFTRARQAEPYTVETLPPLRFEYTTTALNTEIRKITDTSGTPLSIDRTARERWIGLTGTAMPGLLSESQLGLFYRDNLGNGVLSDARTLPTRPSLSGLDEALFVEDRQGRGAKQIVARNTALSGSYQTGHDDLPGGLAPYHGMDTTLATDPRDANLRAIDLTGDGLADRLRTDGETLVWYRTAPDGGFDQAQRVTIGADARGAPAFVFSDPTGLTFLADMSGDGLLDVVRIARRGVRYWPNLGYGRFGQAIDMSAPPNFTGDATLNPDHIRLSDVNGSGLTDIVLLEAGCVTLWENLGGNGFSPAQRLEGLLPDTVPANSVSVTDLLGQGTACLSWTGQTAGVAHGQRLYVDLYSGVKSGLLARVENGFGGSTDLSYRPSTAYARDAAADGRPWATHLHFPVHCLASTRVTDAVTGYSFASSYAYHHGYFDPDDREFRGFARVDQFDSESIQETGGADTARAFFQPTTVTRTWFHTGARLGNRRLEEALQSEFYTHDRLPLDPLPPELPDNLTDTEWAEAQRALKGAVLRTETYSLDDSEKSPHPYSISFGQLRLLRHQPATRQGERDIPPVFQTLQRQSVALVLDRNPDDPRVSQDIVLDWNDWGMPLRGVTLSHGRWGAPDGDTPAEVATLQRQAMAFYAEQSLTDAQDPVTPTPTALLEHPRKSVPTSFAASRFELRGLSLAPWSLADITTLSDRIVDLPTLPHQDQTSPTGRRQIAATRSYFADTDLSEALPLGQSGPTGIVHHSEILAFSAGGLGAIYGDRITDRDMTQAGYVHHADTDTWWVPSGTAVFDETPAARFYLPVGSRDPFGAEIRVTLDTHLLMCVSAEDAVGNTTRLVNDYRHMTPVLSRDANHNWAAVALTALGLPRAVAAMGKVAGLDTPTGTEPCEGSTLDRPSAQFDYDLTAWTDGRGPARLTTTTFVDHGSQTTGARAMLVSHDYTDGMGNLVMTKAQQAPGPAQRVTDSGALEDIDTATLSPPALRWLGNGRTILNNKGQPLRQFEPYFSVTPDYEDDAALVEQGISALPFYDAAGRGIGQFNPDGSWVKTRHTPWRTETWDSADTCLLDPRSDPDLGAHFDGLPPELFAQGWIDRRAGDTRGPEASRAADLSADHAATPMISHLDAGGRPILAVADNGTHGTVTTRMRLDAEGNALAVIDDRDRTVVTSRYNMLPPPDGDSPRPALWQSSMDQGETTAFFDCMGRAAMSWDAHGRLMRLAYDPLGRPVEIWQEQADGTQHRSVLSVFGETAPDAEARNLRGALWQTFDSAGWTETGAHDFLGNVLHSQRRLLTDSGPDPHWPDTENDRHALLSPEVFRSETDYDGLGRPIRSALPYSGDTPTNLDFPGYDEGGALAFVDAKISGGPRNRYVEKITYDAKGQRQMIRLGNGVETHYTYDPETYRLTRLQTSNAAGEMLQDLSYTHDILGNVVAIRDATQPTIHHGGQAVEPVARYTYDALSRLTEATGREHIAQTGAPDWQTASGAAGNVNDLTQMRRYTQFYAYDSTGNILSMRHVADGNTWTRHYGYEATSNRLAWTNTGVDEATGGDSYAYNVAGSMISLPHLGAFALNPAEQMVEVDLGGGGRALYTYDGGGGRVRKRIERSGGTVEERLYLGSLEIYRKWVGGALRLRRETVHISDDAGTIAMVETQTQDANGQIARPDRIERYQLGNHLGSATLELDDTGAILTREEYHPYGTTAFYAAAAGRALPPKRYRYTGQERDEETGLQHHGARYYAPWLARWTSADPIGIGDGLNVYAYVGGRPVGSVDDTGLAERPELTEIDLGLPIGSEGGIALDQDLWNALLDDDLADALGDAPVNFSTIEFTPSASVYALKTEPNGDWSWDDYYSRMAEDGQIQLGEYLVALGFFYGSDPVNDAGTWLWDNVGETIVDNACFPVWSCLISDAHGRAPGVRPGVRPMVRGRNATFRRGTGTVSARTSHHRPIEPSSVALPRQPLLLTGPVPGQATATRNSPGFARGTQGLRNHSSVRNDWMRAGGYVAKRMPLSVAQRLEGRHFKNFRQFREAFWREMANDPVMSVGWSASNLAKMQSGRAPHVPPQFRHGGRKTYELEHIREIQDHGFNVVYLMTNIRVVSPRAHNNKFDHYAPLRPGP